MNSVDRDYLERRHRECLARAEGADDPHIAEVHRRFAAEYERKLAAQSHLPPHRGGLADLR